MTDCPNESMRDLLPLLAHDALDAAEAARLRAHLRLCAACARELAAVAAARTLFSAATPPLRLDAIVRRLPNAPAPQSARVLNGQSPERRVFGVRRYALAAAASLVVVAGLSLALLQPTFFGSRVMVATVDSGTLAPPSLTGALLGAADLADLGADELRALLAELDRMEAEIADEPLTMRPPLNGVSLEDS